MCLLVSQLAKTNYVMQVFKSKLKCEKLVAVVRILKNTQNLFASHYRCAEDGKEMYTDLHV